MSRRKRNLLDTSPSAQAARMKNYWAEVKAGTRPAPKRRGPTRKAPSRSARSETGGVGSVTPMPATGSHVQPTPAEARTDDLRATKREGGDVGPSPTPPHPNSGASDNEKVVSSVRVGSAYTMPEYSDEMLPPPGAGTSLAPSTPPKAKRESPFWKVMEPTPEEFTNLTETFVRLISKGYDGLAAVREYPGWAHSTEEMDPYRTIIKFALRRIKFDPGLLLVALAVIEIAEMEGTRLAGDLKEHKARSDAAKLAARVNTIPEGAVA